MNILQVCQSFYPCFASGGVVGVVYEISKELVSRGNHVTVYTTDGCPEVEGNNKNTKNIEGVNVYYFKNLSKKLKSKFKITNPYHMLWVARKEIKNFDIIHVHEHRTFLAVISHHYAKKYDIPYIIQAHGSIMPHYQNSLFKKFFDKLWGYNILNDAARIIALNETELEQYQLMGVPQDKIVILPNGINLTEYENLPPRGQFKYKHNIKADAKIILYLGRLNRTKGIDNLVKAFPEILNQYKKVKLIIAGPNDGFYDYLYDLINDLSMHDKILLVGPLYDNDKLEAYVDADVFVTPKFSGFPLTFLEACACGTPIVTTDEGDKLDWITDVGFIVNDENLAQCILQILSDDELSHTFGENGKKLVREKFNWQSVSNNIEELYKNV
nr:glycosyltransferase [uncultured Methanobacterium sp.]